DRRRGAYRSESNGGPLRGSRSNSRWRQRFVARPKSRYRDLVVRRRAVEPPKRLFLLLVEHLAEEFDQFFPRGALALYRAGAARRLRLISRRRLGPLGVACFLDALFPFCAVVEPAGGEFLDDLGLCDRVLNLGELVPVTDRHFYHDGKLGLGEVA